MVEIRKRPDSHLTWQPSAPCCYTGSAPDPIRASANLQGDTASSTLTERDQIFKHKCTEVHEQGQEFYNNFKMDSKCDLFAAI